MSCLQNSHMPGVTGDIISLIEKHNIDVNSKHPKSESGLSLFLVSENFQCIAHQTFSAIFCNSRVSVTFYSKITFQA